MHPLSVSTVAPRPRATLVPMARQELAPDVERQLVERAKVDMDGFAELYRHYLPRIHAFAWRRTGNTQAAEDICAATFEAALRGISGYRWRKGGIGPWLFRIAANATIDHHRRESRPEGDRGQQAMAHLHQPEASDDLDGVFGHDDRDRLRTALDQLNPRYQQAIALRYLADLEPDQAARAMGLTKPALAVVLSRALKALRKQLDSEPPGGELA